MTAIRPGDQQAGVAVRTVPGRLSHHAGRVVVHRVYSSGPRIASRISLVSSISKPLRSRVDLLAAGAGDRHLGGEQARARRSRCGAERRLGASHLVVEPGPAARRLQMPARGAREATPAGRARRRARAGARRRSGRRARRLLELAAAPAARRRRSRSAAAARRRRRSSPGAARRRRPRREVAAPAGASSAHLPRSLGAIRRSAQRPARSGPNRPSAAAAVAASPARGR